MLVEWLPLCETQGDNFVLRPGCFIEFGHKCMYVCAQIHKYTHTCMLLIDSTIYKYMYSIQCMLYDLYVFVCVCVCAHLYACVYEPFCSHCSSCPKPLYFLRQYGSEPASGDKNRAMAAMVFPKLKTFPPQMRNVSSVAMWACRSCWIQNTSIISNTWQANIMVAM